MKYIINKFYINLQFNIASFLRTLNIFLYLNNLTISIYETQFFTGAFLFYLQNILI